MPVPKIQFGAAQDLPKDSLSGRRTGELITVKTCGCDIGWSIPISRIRIQLEDTVRIPSMTSGYQNAGPSSYHIVWGDAPREAQPSPRQRESTRLVSVCAGSPWGLSSDPGTSRRVSWGGRLNRRMHRG